jgi:hypothetical protein
VAWALIIIVLVVLAMTLLWRLCVLLGIAPDGPPGGG